MTTLAQTRDLIVRDPDRWKIRLMDFVDDFRFYKDAEAVQTPFTPSDERFDALLASTAEYLCDEAGVEAPRWVSSIRPVASPWFVSGMESLKAIALVESPSYFRARQIFVLANFLSRA